MRTRRRWRPRTPPSPSSPTPVFTDLTAAQVDEFQQRVVGDPAFADRLTRRIQETCGTAK
jgi:hypothetical protein